MDEAELFSNISDPKEREVLRKILVDSKEWEKKKQVWQETMKWIRENKFVTTTHAIRADMKLDYDKKKAKTLYYYNPIPWNIHKYWNSPRKYLEKRLDVMKDRQQWMHGVYSAFMTAGLFGLWLLVLSNYFTYLLSDPTVIPDLWMALVQNPLDMQNVYMISFLVVLVIGILAILINRLRRWIVALVFRRFIIGSLNNYDIESYVIAKCLEMKPKNQEEKQL